VKPRELRFSADQSAESQIPDGIVIGGSTERKKENNVEGRGIARILNRNSISLLVSAPYTNPSSYKSL